METLTGARYTARRKTTDLRPERYLAGSGHNRYSRLPKPTSPVLRLNTICPYYLTSLSRDTVSFGVVWVEKVIQFQSGYSRSRGNTKPATLPTINRLRDRTGGGWNVKEENASRASSSHDTKAEAIARAKELAKKQTLGQVIIHKQDGTIQTEHTYGKDPYPQRITGRSG